MPAGRRSGATADDGRRCPETALVPPSARTSPHGRTRAPLLRDLRPGAGETAISGFGRGTIPVVSTEGWDVQANLSSAALVVLAAIPADGASIGNGRLRAMTELDEPAYKAAVDELVAAGLLRRGRGRGGSVALVGTAPLGNGSRSALGEPRPAQPSARRSRPTADDATSAFDPGALAGPGGLFEKIREHVSTDVGRGLVFQRLMKAFLSEDPLFVERFSRVWQWSEWPGRPPDEGDTGIDLVAQERDGGLCAIQCKFYAPSTTISRDDIDRFLVASGKRPFTARLFVSTTERWGRYAEKVLADQAVPVQRIGIAELSASPFDWSRFDPERLSRMLSQRADATGHPANRRSKRRLWAAHMNPSATTGSRS